jgi:hypothetical protein
MKIQMFQIKLNSFGGRDVEFNSWQIAHFRLLGDDRRLPYGTSVLEKSRRVWKQLLLSEDSMLVYRLEHQKDVCIKYTLVILMMLMLNLILTQLLIDLKNANC